MCFLSSFFSLNLVGDKLSLWPFFLRDNFNCSAELAQWRGLAQTLYGIRPFSAIFFIVSPVFNYENSNLALWATQKVPDVSRHSGR